MRTLKTAKYGEGIKITEIIEHASTRAISKKKFIKFNIEDIESYKYKFSLLIKEETINKRCNYEDRIWFGMSLYYNTYFDFTEFEYNTMLYNALKAYVIVELLNRKLSIYTVGRRYSEVKSALLITNGYKKQNLERICEYIENHELTSLQDFKIGNINFISFYNDFESPEEYIAEFIKISSVQNSDPRTLPPYKSIIWFDYLIKKYIRESEQEKKQKYYLLYLWWTITTVIPMRPNEFLRFKSNCCSYDNEKDEYNLKVPRSKLKPNPLSKKRVLDIADTLKTSKQIYDLIESYVDSENLKSEKYLCSLKAYYRYFTHYDNEIPNNRVNKNKINKNDFYNIIDAFYDEVIKGVYGFEYVRNGDELKDNNMLVVLKPGDTRHLAFYSMFLQGINPLTIAKIGGQESLSAQNHYLNHLDEFSDAHTLMLSKDIELKMLNSKKSIDEVILTSDRIRKTFIEHDDFEPRIVEDGFCYSRNFPYECVDTFCWPCDYYKFDYENMDKASKDKL